MTVTTLHTAPVATLKELLSLLKPRVMMLVVFTGAVGMWLAPGHLHPFLQFLTILCIALGSGAGGMINMWYDRDIDAIMTRTAKRPLVIGSVSAEDVLVCGIMLSVASVMIMGLAMNWTAAGLLAFAIFFYAVIYTMWLKRRTPQNIVIGGAAGAFPPMIGWVAMTGDISLESVVLFLIIFFWTPPHFWALALVKRHEYARAGVPMLPVVAGGAETRRQIFIYSAILAPLGVAPALLGFSGALYGIAAALLGAVLIVLAIDLFRSRKGVAADRAAYRLFGFSILYLFLLF